MAARFPVHERSRSAVSASVSRPTGRGGF
jgi:hypothetical protein